MDNKKVIIAAVLFVILGGIFFIWVNSGKEPEKKTSPEQSISKESVETIDPAQLGLTLTPRADKRAVTLEMTNLSGITAIGYELSYIAKGDIPRGVIGSIEVKPSDKKITRELLLGTCSRNVCKYDEGVTEVSLVVKVTKIDKVLQAEKKIPL